MTPVESLAAALDKAEKRLDAATPGPWSRDFTYLVGMVRGGRPNGEVFANMSPSVPHHFPPADLIATAALIVSVVNRERAQIQHARDVLRTIDYLRTDSVATDQARRIAGYLESYLLAVWCSEPTP